LLTQQAQLVKPGKAQRFIKQSLKDSNLISPKAKLQVIKNGCLPTGQQLLAASKFGLVPNMAGADVLKGVLFYFLCANQCALYMLVVHWCSHCHKMNFKYI
jgi:hypothetical protein